MLTSIWNRLILYKKAVLFIIFIDQRWSRILNGHYESSAENVASTAGYRCVPMRRSGLESVIWDPSDRSKSIESMNPFPWFIDSFNTHDDPIDLGLLKILIRIMEHTLIKSPGPKLELVWHETVFQWDTQPPSHKKMIKNNINTVPFLVCF